MLKLISLVVLAAAVAGLVWIRMAPDNPARWHKTSDAPGLGHVTGSNWHVYRERVEGDGTARLEELDAALRALPRTKVLAGSPETGRITYVTRSKVMGFPDYTTISLTDAVEGPIVEVFARSRYGDSDLGVNRRRVTALPGIPE